MSHAGNPLITRLLAHAAAAKAARAASGTGPHGDSFTVPELADILAISIDTIYDAINNGRLEAFRPMGRIVEGGKHRCRMVRGVSLRSALIYVLESTEGMTDEAMAETIIRVLPQLGRDELLTRITSRITDIRTRRGVMDNHQVLEALEARPRPGFVPVPSLRVLPPPSEVQPDLFEIAS